MSIIQLKKKKDSKFEVICHAARITEQVSVQGMRGCYNKHLKHVVLALGSSTQNLEGPCRDHW